MKGSVALFKHVNHYGLLTRQPPARGHPSHPPGDALSSSVGLRPRYPVPSIKQMTLQYYSFFIFGVLTPLSTIFQLYHGNQF